MTDNHLINDRYIDFGIILKEIKNHWFLFLLFIVISFLGVFVYNKLATPSYKISARLLIKDSQNDKANVSDFLDGFELVSSKESFENEVLILNSPQLVERTLKSLDLSISYFTEERYFTKKELYKSTPFLVNINRNHLQPVGVMFKVVFKNEKTCLITADAEVGEVYNYLENKVYDVLKNYKFSKIVNVGDDVLGDIYNFKIIPSSNSDLKQFIGQTLYFRLNNDFNQIYSYQSRITVSPHSPKSTVAILDYSSTNIQKGLDFLNSLIQNYIQKNIDRKNFIAERTIDYIDQQLAEITDSLNITERQLQDFRVNNQVLNINVKSDRVVDEMQLLDNSRYQLQIKENYYKYILEYFRQNKDLNEVPIPSSMGFEDQILTQLIQQLAAMNSEKSSLEKNNQQKNPYYITLNSRVENVKNNINENLKYSLNSIKLNLDDINQRFKKFQGEMNKLPRTERELFNIERKYKVTDAIYTFLLEKRAEAQIAKASNLPDIEIVEPARYAGKSFPNSKINYLIGLFIGLFIPGAFVFLKNALNNKINENIPIEKLTRFPILGQIMHNHRVDEQVFINYPKSAIAESFRAVRTNLDYFTQGNDKRVIMLTSSVGNEGKSFTSLNLALCFSVYERRTILLEFDLRKPTLYQKLGHENLIGLSSYLINKANIDDIIMPTKFKNFDFIPCGPIPPNPTELIASERTERLISKLKGMYDLIIIDSPPLGLVTDAYLLMKHSDIKVYMVRQNVAPINEFVANIREIELKQIESMTILLNDVKFKPGAGKYGYGYYDERSRWKKKKKVVKQTPGKIKK